MRKWRALPLVLVLAVGCATGGGRDVVELVPREDRYFLIDPLTGYPRSVGSDDRLQLEKAHRELVEEGNRGRASDLATTVAGRNPELVPVQVLQGQIDFSAGLYSAVLDRLDPVVGLYPEYVAAQLLYGRAAERTGDLVRALHAYESIAAGNALAQSRVLDLGPRLAGAMAREIEADLAKGRTGEALEKLGQLQEWAPDAEQTLGAAVDVARAREDQTAELVALRRLVNRRPEDLALVKRQAELELKVGDPAAGMSLIEELAARDPGDLNIQEQLAQAKFLWRIQLLPAEVRTIADQPELTRADFAILLYWLFPEVRYGRVGDARIANDILDHPQREALVRVINAGIMDVDSSLHQFSPYRALTRGDALEALIRLMAKRQPVPTCVGTGGVPSSRQGICSVAAGCGLIAETEDCLPEGSVAGTDAVEMCRLTQDSSGSG